MTEEKKYELGVKMIEAIDANDVFKVKEIIKEGLDVPGKSNALIYACYCGNLDIVKHLVESGADVSFQDDEALISCATHNHVEVMKYLLENGVDIHLKGEKALFRASFHGHLETIRFLTESGVNIHAEDNKILTIAVVYEHVNIVRYLIVEQDCDIQIALQEAKDYSNKEMVNWCQSYIESKKLNNILEIELSQNFDKIKVKKPRFEMNKKEQEKLNADLIQAAMSGNLKEVIKLIENGADLHVNNNDALTLASSYGNLGVVKYLVEKGADIHALDDAPLFNAATYGNLEVVKYLIQKGANVHGRNNQIINEASYRGHLEVMKCLVREGAIISSENKNAFSNACWNGRLDIAQYLVLEHGFDIQRALDIAKINKKQEMIEWCEGYIKKKNLNERLTQDLVKSDVVLNNKKKKV